MRRPLIALALLALVIALATAACTSAAPGWTYAPPTPAPTPGPSVEASGAAPSGAAPSGAAPSDAAPSGGTPTEVPGGGSGATVEISAINIAFDQTEVVAPADAPFVIHFVNKDAGIPHNVEVKDASGMSMFKGNIITGPAEATYQVPALAAGTYQFTCTVHPNMVGSLKVGS